MQLLTNVGKYKSLVTPILSIIVPTFELLFMRQEYQTGPNSKPMKGYLPIKSLIRCDGGD